jgi:arylsulfatase A-like enzyme
MYDGGMETSMRKVSKGLAMLLMAGSGMVLAGTPNLVVFLADDQGWGDLGCTGNPVVQTPNIDALAQGGARFDHFYVSPVCSPTRAEFLTGRHHVRSGVWSTSRGGERINADETLIAEIFRNAGYKTAAFGKWHSGMQYPYHPNARGFDEFYGFCSGHWGNYFSPMLEHNGRLVEGNGFVIDDFTDHAIDFIETHRDSPLLVYLPYNTPHSPMQVPGKWWNKYKDAKLPRRHRYEDREDKDHTRAALAMCENIDWNVGRVLATLDELDLADNTIVVYFSDNGPNGFRWNDGLRGKKGSTDEGGVRSPLFIRWPGQIAADTHIPQISSAMDLLPTLADLAGVSMRGKMPLDGVSLKPLLLGEKEPSSDRMLFSYWNRKLSVRTQRLRFDHDGRLYDMVSDPGQLTDVASQYPAETEKMRNVSNDWKSEMLTGLYDDTRPFVIGHPAAKHTQIPARDGEGHGNIKRSNKFPNDSFFSNWIDPGDRITWNCEVGRTGTYQVEVYYTCPEADIGSTVELSFNGSRLVGKITEAHNPPLAGMEHDRVVRRESYVKDFRAMTLGTIHLEEGKGTLGFRALEIPASQVMDFRLLFLTRLD